MTCIMPHIDRRLTPELRVPSDSVLRRRCRRNLLAFATLVMLVWLAAAPARAEYVERLPPPVAQALKHAGIPPAAAAVVVQEAGAVLPRVSLNAGQSFNPASVMKLLTTYAALDTLGPAYTWKTEALAVAAPAGGVLDGDLVLKGSGDPKLTFEQFWLLLRQLRARGVREIRGDLVLDRRLFDANGITAAEAVPFDDKPLRPYNVAPDALLLNFKSLRLQLVGDAARKSFVVLAEPQPGNLEIVNQIRPTGGAGNADCGDWKEGLHAEVSQHAGRSRLTLNGQYPLSCGEQTWNLGVLTHPQYVFGVFSQLWQELGGTLTGTLRESAPAGNLQRLASIESPTLAEIVRDINKYSNNVMARQLFLTLGAELAEKTDAAPKPVRPADADAALRAWLAQKQLNFPELVLENGSGLSRRERISAESLARLLASAWKSPLMPEYIASLPLTAVDGTMKKRLRIQGVAGQAHIKTGSLEGVKTIAGYVLDRRGKWQIVVFLINHPNAAAAQAAQDALLQWVYERAN